MLQLSTLCFRSHSAAGDVDLSFDPGSGVNGPVSTVVVQPDGKLIIAGEFTAVQGLLRPGLARLNADGTGDSSFNPAAGTNGTDRLIASQPAGKGLVASGYSSLVRLHADGSIDSNFNPDVPQGNILSPFDYFKITALAVQADGKIFVGGYSVHYDCGDEGCIVDDGYFVARLQANGSRDTNFIPALGNQLYGGGETVDALGVQPDGSVVVGGYYHSIKGTNRFALARLRADDSLDQSFNSPTDYHARISSIAMQPDGKFFINGGTGRLNFDGTLDNSFNLQAAPYAGVSFAFQPDGKLLIGGSFTNVNGTGQSRIARLNANGSLDNSFNPGTGANGRVVSIALQSNGPVFIVGTFTSVNGTNCNRVARLNTDGSLDGNFHVARGVESPVSSLVVQPDGKALIGGPLTFINGTNRYGRERLNADGRVDISFISKSFNPDLTGLIPNDDCPPGFPDPCVTITVPECSAVQSNGKVLVGGYALTTESYFDGDIFYYRHFVARFHGNGSRDTSFGQAVGDRVYWDKQTVRAIAVQPDGRVVVVGIFNLIHGTDRRGIARLNANGSLDTGFVPGIPALNAGVDAVALQSDGKVLVGGYFNFGIARLNDDGSLDGRFNASTEPYGVSSVALQSNGKVLVGGGFTSVNGMARNRIALLNSNGSLDLDFDPGTGADGVVRTIALQSDGKVLLGGEFTTVNGVVRASVARLYGADVTPSLTIARTMGAMTISWPLSATGFVLDQSLTTTGVWSQVAFPYSTNAGAIRVSADTPTGNKFYRLRKL